MEFGKRIKELRQQEGMTQKDLAQVLQCSQSRVSDWEKDICEPSVNALIKACQFFSISADYLLGLENEDGTKNY